MTPELARRIVSEPVDPYLQQIVRDIYRIWGTEEFVRSIAHYRAEQTLQDCCENATDT